MNKLSILPFLAAVLLLNACQSFDDLEDLDGAKYDAEYAFPLINTELSIRDALENFEDQSTLVIDPDGLIHFIYEGEVVTQNSDTIFKQINETLSGIPIPITSQRMGIPLEFPDGISFDELVFKDGKFSFFFQHRHPDPVSLRITLPQVSKNGDTLSLEGSLPAYGGSGAPPSYLLSLAIPTSLAGYEVSTGSADSVYVEYELTRQGGLQDTASAVGILFQELSFYYMEGFLGRFVQEGGRDTIRIDFFDDWVKGDIYFEDPTVTFNIENSFGIPTVAKVNTFEVFTVRGEILKLESEFVENGIAFPYPGLDEVGQVATRNFVFDKNNSNIDEILSAGPLAIDYDVDAVSNPDSNENIRGFITDSSYYRVGVTVDLPLFGRSLDFLAQDTFAIDFSDFQQVYKAEFKLVTINGLPLDVAIQGHFVDSTGAVLDSLFQTQQKVVEGAPVDEDGVASGVKEDVTFVDFPEERFNKVRNAAELIIIASFSTLNDGQQSVKVLADQSVQIKMGAIFGIKDEE